MNINDSIPFLVVIIFLLIMPLLFTHKTKRKQLAARHTNTLHSSVLSI